MTSILRDLRKKVLIIKDRKSSVNRVAQIRKILITTKNHQISSTIFAMKRGTISIFAKNIKKRKENRLRDVREVEVPIKRIKNE